MKILLVTHYYQPHVGGIEIIAYNQARELARQGHEVTILTSQLLQDQPEEITEGIRIVRVPIWNWFEEKFGVPYPVFSPALARVLRREIAACDLVHAHGILYQGSHVGARIAQKYGKPFFVTEHVAHVKYKNPLIDWIESIALRTIGVSTLKKSAQVLVYNSYVHWWMKQYGIEPVNLSNGVDFTLFHPPTEQEKQASRAKFGLPQDRFIVLFVGRFVAKKGFDVLYAARHPAYLLVFVGGGAAPDFMREDNSVRILGSLAQSELAQVYQAADTFILPSYGEGFPLSIQEAMATGLPVITSKQNALEPIAGSRLVSFVDINADQIRSAILDLQNNAELRRDMGEFVSHTARANFSWEGHCRKLVELYQQKTTPSIIQVSSYYPPHLGGTEAVVERIAAGLISKQYPVSVYTSTIGCSKEFKKRTDSHVHYLNSIEIAHTPILFTLLFHLLRIPRRSIMHLHISQAFSPEMVYIASKLRNIPYITHIHLDVDPSGRFGFLLEPYKRIFLQIVLRSATRIICLSAAQKNLIAAKYALPLEAIEVIPNGVSDAFFVGEHIKSNGVPRLLFVGRLAAQKNLSVILQALKLMREKVELDVVGEGELRPQIIEFIQKLGLTNVHLHGRKEGQELLDFYQSADIFILPSVKEGVSLAMLEALAAGLPIVASNTPEIREVLGDCALIVDDSTPENYASLLDRLAANPEERQRLSFLATQKARAYSWDRVMDSIQAVYRSVMAAR